MKDDEVYGVEGTSYTAEYWQYDSRLGRRWNMDPMRSSKLWLSPYHAFSNKPILNIDPNGANDGDYYDKNGTHLGKDDRTDNLVYTTTKEYFEAKTNVSSGARADYDGLRNTSEKLSITHDDFLQFAGIINRETEPMKGMTGGGQGSLDEKKYLVGL